MERRNFLWWCRLQTRVSHMFLERYFCTPPLPVFPCKTLHQLHWKKIINKQKFNSIQLVSASFLWSCWCWVIGLKPYLIWGFLYRSRQLVKHLRQTTWLINASCPFLADRGSRKTECTHNKPIYTVCPAKILFHHNRVKTIGYLEHNSHRVCLNKFEHLS